MTKTVSFQTPKGAAIKLSLVTERGAVADATRMVGTWDLVASVGDGIPTGYRVGRQTSWQKSRRWSVSTRPVSKPGSPQGPPPTRPMPNMSAAAASSHRTEAWHEARVHTTRGG
jgi:hypothetical protein